MRALKSAKVVLPLSKAEVPKETRYLSSICRTKMGQSSYCLEYFFGNHSI